MKSEEYLLARDYIYNFLNESTFTRGVSIVNIWNFYGRAVIKLSNKKFIYTDFKILMKENHIEYYMGFNKLGELEFNQSFFFNAKSNVNIILNEIVKELRRCYTKM